MTMTAIPCGPSPVRSAPPPPPPATLQRVLIIDDYPPIRAWVRTTLARNVSSTFGHESWSNAVHTCHQRHAIR
ncbi:hypothetical protein, partial [Candidatus Chloroploca sp. Khr17]|uniref:hypothetical protein n=1 Tax=Candidatus Chloroploca sp. Khr17 TaxID=2496869 RepID=UPI00196ADBAB